MKKKYFLNKNLTNKAIVFFFETLAFCSNTQMHALNALHTFNAFEPRNLKKKNIFFANNVVEIKKSDFIDFLRKQYIFFQKF